MVKKLLIIAILLCFQVCYSSSDGKQLKNKMHDVIMSDVITLSGVSAAAICAGTAMMWTGKLVFSDNPHCEFNIPAGALIGSTGIYITGVGLVIAHIASQRYYSDNNNRLKK